jgi:hypothetical protein
MIEVLYHVTDSEENIRTSFSLGDDDDDDETDDIMVDSKGTQTAALQSLSPLKRLVSYEEPRSLKQCIEILKSDVSFV